MPIKIDDPTCIDAPDDKYIEEFVGRQRTGTQSLSVARMTAPPQWSEPFQQPEFDEVTVVVEGVMRVECDGDVLDVHAGEAVLVEAGERIRYSNPTRRTSRYWAVCAPAFCSRAAHREKR